MTPYSKQRPVGQGLPSSAACGSVQVCYAGVLCRKTDCPHLFVHLHILRVRQRLQLGDQRAALALQVLQPCPYPQPGLQVASMACTSPSHQARQAELLPGGRGSATSAAWWSVTSGFQSGSRFQGSVTPVHLGKGLQLLGRQLHCFEHAPPQRLVRRRPASRVLVGLVPATQ